MYGRSKRFDTVQGLDTNILKNERVCANVL